MKRLATPAVMAATFLASLAAIASVQLGPRLERLEVAIWPEYDQPAALVMYRGWLPAGTPLPTTVTLPMPAAVPAPSAVAKRGGGQQLLVAPYTMETEGDWKQIHVQTDVPEVRLEFYADLETSNAARRFTFEWVGGPEVGNVSYEVMQPIGATDFSVTPSSTPPSMGGDGLVYQLEELGPVPAGGAFFIEVAYTKTTPGLTASALPPTTPPPQPATPGSGTSATTAPAVEPPDSAGQPSIWLVVIPVLFAAGLAALWIVLSTRTQRPR